MTSPWGRPPEWAFGHITCGALLRDPSGAPCLNCKEWLAFEIRMTRRFDMQAKPICLREEHRCRRCPISRLCCCYDPLADLVLATEAKARRLEAWRQSRAG